MTIKTTSSTQTGDVIKCFNCSNEEKSTTNGRQQVWSSFTFEVGTCPHIECLKCGYKYPRNQLALGKRPHSETIHLGMVKDGDLFISRCGLVSGNLTKGSVVEVKSIPNSILACKKCSIEEGIASSAKEWAQDSDIEVEKYFYRHI